MATSPSVASRDDDPAHPNFDGIVFYATTDRTGIVATPETGQQKPPVSFMPVAFAVRTAHELGDMIGRIRRVDSASYLADYLETIRDDLSAAIEGCLPEDAP